MTLADVIAQMRAAGCSHEQIGAVAAGLTEKPRTKNALRQARFRAKAKEAQAAEPETENVTNPITVTPPVTLTVTPDNEKEIPPTPPKEKTTPLTNSSLRSELAPSPKAKRTKVRTPIAPDAQPTEADRRASEDAGLTPQMFRAEWGKFRDYHLSKGNLMADWSAAWRTWLVKVAQFQPSNIAGYANGSGPPRTVQDVAREFENAASAGDLFLAIPARPGPLQPESRDLLRERPPGLLPPGGRG